MSRVFWTVSSMFLLLLFLFFVLWFMFRALSRTFITSSCDLALLC